MPWKVSWRVTVDGRDMSAGMRPYLIAISVSDKDGMASDAASLTFDDAVGQLLLPKGGANVAIELDGVRIFEGVVDGTPWALTRGGGRILSVSAKGLDTRGRAKEGQTWHLDDATLDEALQKGAKVAGLEGITVDRELGQLKRPYWSPQGASFLGWARRLAADHGATFKVRGSRAVFAKRGQGASAAGGAMPTVEAKIPGNVITAHIDPAQGRRAFKAARVRYFDRKKATFEEKDVEIGADDTEAVNVRRFTAADGDEADAIGQGRRSDAERERATGTIEMDLEPAAQAEGTLNLTGARAGIDGSYRIVGVTHKADRGGGATTSIEIKQPQGEAGKDSRTPTQSTPANVPIPTPRAT
ncbi:phage late control D family protein [Aureimonas pseudogalii]|uniref:Late control protein n=1 Tax=Aureimonas pseudogalii TaxID=1744844 RepID=A0A7W6E8T3_9HYPH|nr:late control D family protein [Aureimonas pseudogalii]MBB3996862.1 hypothetical protein [Aureimonas pseudogalii]